MKALVTGTLADIHACFPPTAQVDPTTRTFFIQGAAGSGKSLFCWRTMQYFDSALRNNGASTSTSTGTGGLCSREFEAAKQSCTRVPVVISLPSVKQRVEEGPFDFLVLGLIIAQRGGGERRGFKRHLARRFFLEKSRKPYNVLSK